MVLVILCVEPIYPKYSGVLKICLALRYCFVFEVLGSESVKRYVFVNLFIHVPIYLFIYTIFKQVYTFIYAIFKEVYSFS